MMRDTVLIPYGLAHVSHSNCMLLFHHLSNNKLTGSLYL